ncbi:MAG: LEPR-XLL domain-containing protein [Fibrobacter sp.]|nr:LEPR-XLL domain-containing protein [Fibrobacter sp.]
MNENSRKSSKKVSSKSAKAKKVSKKNFKIENLEPRLMMDAASGFEVEK